MERTNHFHIGFLAQGMGFAAGTFRVHAPRASEHTSRCRGWGAGGLLGVFLAQKEASALIPSTRHPGDPTTRTPAPHHPLGIAPH